uniref:Uncharacterized protein n=1 Tax=Bracon brevicornis TaxID=1563983 RepID=A0A6V7LI73_9HYME
MLVNQGVPDYSSGFVEGQEEDEEEEEEGRIKRVIGRRSCMEGGGEQDHEKKIPVFCGFSQISGYTLEKQSKNS